MKLARARDCLHPKNTLQTSFSKLRIPAQRSAEENDPTLDLNGD